MLNSECLEVFNKYLVEVKKCSTNTLSSYMRDVRQFGDYMQTHTTEDIVSATKDELSEYIDWLKGNGKSVATVSRAIACSNACTGCSAKTDMSAKIQPLSSLLKKASISFRRY